MFSNFITSIEGPNNFNKQKWLTLPLTSNMGNFDLCNCLPTRKKLEGAQE